MKVYKTKTKKVSGTNYSEVYHKSHGFYSAIKKRTKRQPYIRSAYFQKDKIFLELFWQHLQDKENFRDKTRRMKYFPAAIELIQKTKFDPESIDNPNKSSELLHRFFGLTKEGEFFCVQIKEEKKSGKKWLISAFPKKHF